mgnify:CR=1 FL=1|jgi:VanZ family protein
MIQVPPEVFGILLLLCALLVLWGLLSPVDVLPNWIRAHDKWMHAVAFGGLAGLTNLWLQDANVGAIWLALVVAGLLGEVAQHFSVHRRFCWRDALANTLGVTAGLTIIQWLLSLSDSPWLVP